MCVCLCDVQGVYHTLSYTCGVARRDVCVCVCVCVCSTQNVLMACLLTFVPHLEMYITNSIMHIQIDSSY